MKFSKKWLAFIKWFAFIKKESDEILPKWRLKWGQKPIFKIWIGSLNYKTEDIFIYPDSSVVDFWQKDSDAIVPKIWRPMWGEENISLSYKAVQFKK